MNAPAPATTHAPAPLGTGVDPPLHEWQTVALPTGVLQVNIDHTRIPFNALLGIAARNNLKRGFLFLSKVLGKHWPVSPEQMQAVHLDLVAQIPPNAPGPVLFIALAETAIGLGQGVFETWLAAHPEQNALFLHSSRYRLGQRPMIEFEETHSHAPRQFLHLPEHPELLHLLQQARTLVLVDDEASTGNTFVNICAALRAQNLPLEHIHLALITDFMGPETRAQLPQRFGLPVSIGATLCGQYRFTPNPPESSVSSTPSASSPPPPATSQQTRIETSPVAAPPAPAATAITAAPAAQRAEFQADHIASPHFGRLGIRRALQTQGIQALAAKLATHIPAGQTVLVLGTGEFMHPACLLAQALAKEARKAQAGKEQKQAQKQTQKQAQKQAFSVLVQSSTRSPILCWGAAQQCLQFPDNYGEGIANYLYNVTPGQYPVVLICHETPPNAGLQQMARMLSARLFHFHTENQIEEIPVC